MSEWSDMSIRSFSELALQNPPKRVGLVQGRNHYHLIDCKGVAEAVIRRMTDNTMTQRKRPTVINKNTRKTKDRETRTPLKTGGELVCYGRVGSSCSTRGTHLVTFVLCSHHDITHVALNNNHLLTIPCQTVLSDEHVVLSNVW